MIRLKRLRPDAILPVRGTPGSVGLDLAIPDDVVLYRGVPALISLGFAVELPAGTFGDIRERSSWRLKGVTISGVIDSDYRGPVGLLAIAGNFLKIPAGTRVAQMLVTAYTPWGCVEVDELGETSRKGGFGSTS